MHKSINERLFEQLMRAPRVIRKAAEEADFEEEMSEGHHGHGPDGEHGHGHKRGRGFDGPRGKGRGPGRGHGPEDEDGHGPEDEDGHGPEGEHGHGPEGEHGHGPEGRGHGPKRGHGPGGGKPHPAFGRERLLSVIGSYEGGVRQKTLTEELRVNPSSVSELISKLESDGYVRRSVDPADKRATLISLTELGEARNAEVQDERNERLEAAFCALTEDEKEQLIALLDKLAAGKQG